MSEGREAGASGGGEEHASMGPTSLDVGGIASAAAHRRRRLSSFNGADISRCRRGGRWLASCDLDGARYRFNGADISRCRRALDAPIGSVSRPPRLQWGRHLSMSEGPLPLAPRAPLSCFNGADISRCRRGKARAWERTRPLQWGRHLSMSEGRTCTTYHQHGEALLQWGRHLSMSEGTEPGRERVLKRLQWGRHLSMSEGRRTPT